MTAPAHFSPSPFARASVTAAAAATAFSVLVWLACTTDAWRTGFGFTGQQHDYYNLLVDGLLEGSPALKVDITFAPAQEDVHRRLPEPFLLDANYYRGRYFLYYGAVPAVLLMLPYSALTGHDLSTNVVVLVFLAVGYVAALAAYRRIRQAYFPTLALAPHALFVLVLGWGAAQPFLAVRGAFYEVPAAGTYTFTMLGAWAIATIVTGTRRPLCALAAASLALGLAVGCRPVALFALPALLLPAWFILRSGRPSRPLLAFALLTPAAGIGVMLALYNYARFDHPLEFGFRYGLNSYFDSDSPLASVRFIWPNLTWYYLSPPSFSPYFPFFFPVAASFVPPGYYGVEAVHGQLWLTLAFALVLAVILLSRLLRERLPAVRVWLGTLLALAVPPGAFLVILTIRGNRYLADFQPALVLGLVTILGLIFTTPPTRALRFVRWKLSLILSLGLLVTLGSALQQFDQFQNSRPTTITRIASMTNHLSDFAARLGWLDYGPVEFDVRFPINIVGARAEPLLVVGLAEYTDSLQANLHSGNYVELQLDHHGHGGPRSPLIQVEPGRTYRISVQLGALLPPVYHPYFSDIPLARRQQIKRQAIVTFDDAIVIDRAMGYYDAPPWTLITGRNDITRKPFGREFTGEITPPRRLPAPAYTVAPVVHTAAPRGSWFLDLAPPPANSGLLPILAAGPTGAGNLLAIHRSDDTHIIFSLDTWSVGLAQSPLIALPLNRTLQFEIFVLNLINPAQLPPEWELAGHPTLSNPAPILQIWHENQCLWQVRIPAHESAFNDTLIGANTQGFTTAAVSYPEPILERILPLSTQAALMRRALDFPPP